MKKKAGFTIVELLLYMGLMAILLVVMGGIFFSVLDLQLESQGSSDVQQDGEFILARIGYDVRRASSVTVPASAGQTGNSLVLVIGGTSYTYAVSGTDLGLSVGGVTQFLTSYGSNISNFSVTRLGNPGGKASLDISFTLTSKTSTLNQIYQTKNYEEALTLR